MECVDGVCRFVPKSQRQAAASSANDENAPPQAALPPVKVGDVPPMPLPLEPIMEGQGEATTVQALTQEKGMVVVLGTCLGWAWLGAGGLARSIDWDVSVATPPHPQPPK